MRYKIWDKKTDILTLSGELHTPEGWMNVHPITQYVDTVISGGEINGAYFDIYSQLKERWEKNGLDFSNCKTQQEVLDLIEQTEDKQREKQGPDYQEEMMYALQDIAVNTMPMEEL